jgi:MFS family permease
VLLLLLQSLLGQVDLAFLAAYAIGMFFAGHIGDRTDLRMFLAVGMVGSGMFCTLFGLVSSCIVYNPKSLTQRFASSLGLLGIAHKLERCPVSIVRSLDLRDPWICAKETLAIKSWPCQGFLGGPFLEVLIVRGSFF